MRPGWQSSEYWTVIGAAVISVGAVLLQATPTQQAEANEHWAKAVTAVVGLLTFAATAWRYIASREAVKMMESVTPEDVPGDEVE